MLILSGLFTSGGFYKDMNIKFTVFLINKEILNCLQTQDLEYSEIQVIPAMIWSYSICSKDRVWQAR